MDSQEHIGCVDTKQAANLLGYGQRYIIRLCNEGAIKGAVKKGSQWWIPTATVEVLQAEKKNLMRDRVKIINLLRPYALQFLAVVGQRMQQTQEEILELKEQPIIDDASKFLIRKLEDKFAGQLRYFSEILRNIDAAENSISTIKANTESEVENDSKANSDRKNKSRTTSD